MKGLETNTLEALLRTRQFGLTHADKIPDGSAGADAFATVNQIIEEMEHLSGEQARLARAVMEKTTQKRLAFELMREEMKAMRRTAAPLERSRPGLLEAFKLPTSNRDQALLAAARSFAAAATPLKDEFVRHGMKPDFLGVFNGRIAAAEACVDDRAQTTAAGVNITDSLADAAERGRAALKACGAYVFNVFRDDRATLTEWESVSHIERPSPRSKGDGPANGNTPPPDNTAPAGNTAAQGQ